MISNSESRGFLRRSPGKQLQELEPAEEDDRRTAARDSLYGGLHTSFRLFHLEVELVLCHYAMLCYAMSLRACNITITITILSPHQYVRQYHCITTSLQHNNTLTTLLQ